MTHRWPGPRIRRDRYGYLIVDGYTWLGPAQIPPLPPFIRMEDRVTGDFKILSHTGTYPTLTLNVTDPPAGMTHYEHYAKYDGPYLNDGFNKWYWRLYLTSGTLTAEVTDRVQDNSRVITRRGNEVTGIDITINSGGTLIYTPFEF